MGFVIKFLKELNSSNSSKFVTLSVVLGLLSGFLPFFNIFSLIIIFAAFLLRIPLGLYFASWGVFEIIGHLLDPFFNVVGYEVLTASFLKSFFTYLYNVPFMRWSGFNNTAVVGGLLIGLVFAAAVYFILNKFIDTYRKILFSKLKNIKLLSWIVPLEENKKGMFRISGLIALILIVSLVSVFFMLFFDPLIKKGLEFTLSKTFHKPVEIKKFKTSFKNSFIEISEMDIGKIEISKIYVKFNPKWLVWKKFDIEDLVVKNIKSNKKIQDLLKIHNKQTHKKASFKLPKIKIPKAENFLKDQKLKTPVAIKNLEKDYKQFLTVYKQINNSINKDNKKLKQIQSEIRKIADKSKHIKNINDVNDILTQVNKIKKEIKALKNNYKNYSKEISTYKSKVLKDIKLLKTALKSDYSMIDKKYALLKNGEYMKFSQSFLKPEINQYINYALYIYNKIKPYLNKHENKNKIIRTKGMYIKFKDKINYPDFVLEKADLGIIFKNAVFNVKLLNITDNQKLLNKKMTADINSSSKFYKLLNLKITKFKKIKYSLLIQKLKINEIKTEGMVFAHPLIDVKSYGEIIKGNISALIKIYFTNVEIKYTKSKVVDKIVSKINSFDLKIKLYGKLNHYKIDINSDIDKKLSSIVNKQLIKELEKQKKRAKEILNKKVSEELKKVKINTDVLNLINDKNIKLKNLDKELRKYGEKELKKKILQKGLKNLLKF